MATLLRDAEVQSTLADLEDLWRCFDELYDRMTDADWRRRHGRDWTFADLPYHLSYFDREIVAEPIRRGTDVPLAAQRVMRTMDELNAWNAAHFAERPVDVTPALSIARARAARDEVRAAAATLTDDDLDRPGFVPLPGCGWLSARDALNACVGHTWSHFSEARLRLGRWGRLEAPSTRHRALSFYLNMMPMFADPAEAAKGPFTAVMTLTGPGGGTWTYRVQDGRCFAEDGAAHDADVTVTQSPETFVKTFTKMHNPMLSLLTGKMKVKGFGQMGRFGRIFSEPGPGREFLPGRERL
jgi:hypothetical protein